MKLLRQYWMIVAVILLVAVGFHRWFFRGMITAPDFPYYYAQHLGEMSLKPFAWSNISGGGMGGSTLATLNIDSYVHAGIQLFVFILHVPWTVASRLMLFWPFLVLASVGSFLLVQQILSDVRYGAFGSLIYLTNTYILMIVGGGQMGIAMAYAVAPFVVYAFIKKRPIMLTVATFFLFLFDLRYAYILVILLLGYIVCTVSPRKWWSAVKWCIIPACIVVGLHLFWIIPFVLFRSYGLPAGYGNAGWLSYLSWADFSKTISLLHPNWPENIFGKTYFMKPGFLLIPIFAFSALFSISKSTDAVKRDLLFWTGVGLVGAFLAKGVNGPFGVVYDWLFLHIPFFNGFRDPTKFYLLIALSYSILIPYTLVAAVQLVKKGWRKRPIGRIPIVSILWLTIWICLLSPLYLGKVSGTFRSVSIPSEYMIYADAINTQTSFSRTLAVPWRNRFIFDSETHPVIDASSLFHTTDLSVIAKKMQDPGTERLLQRYAVSEIVVPNDFTHEIFLRDRSYDDSLRLSMIYSLDRAPGLVKQKGFGDLAVYKLTDPIGLFTRDVPHLDPKIYNYKEISPVTYTVDVEALETPTILTYATTFDPHWQLWVGDRRIASTETTDGLNSFVIPTDVTREVTLHYIGQLYVDLGVAASEFMAIVIVLVFSFSIMERSKRRNIYIGATIVGIGLAGILWAVRHRSVNDIMTNPSVWWSRDWIKVHDPFLSETRVISRVGGSELRFIVSGTRSISLTATSPNNEKGSQGFDITVDGKKYTKKVPMHHATFLIPIANPSVPSNVQIRFWCAGTLSPCDIAIQHITIDNGAVVMKPASVPKKMFAVLGDSIAVSFGDINAMYLVADKLGYQLHNASIFGSSVTPVLNWDSALLRYKRDIVRIKPDVVLVFVGTNDLGQSIPVSKFSDNYHKLVQGILVGTPRSKVILMGLMNRMDYPIDEIRAYSSVIEETARTNHLDYIDPFYWMAPGDLQDVIHPAPKSEPKFAEKLYDALIPLLKNE